MLNPLPSEVRWISLKGAQRMVDGGIAEWRQMRMAIWRVDKRPAQPRLMEVSAMGRANLHQLSGIPVVLPEKLIGAGSRSAGPAFKGGKWGGPRVW